MSHKRHVWETISELALRLDDASGDGFAKLEEQLGKLGREQYKANTLAQAQAERLQAALESLQSATTRLGAVQHEAVQKARLDILKALLPVLDGLEAGLESGQRQVATLAPQTSDFGFRISDSAIRNPQSAIEGGQDAQAAAILAAWLDGQRLLRDRLLALLGEAGIQPVPTVGQPFDPYCHVAVGTIEDETLPDGQIVAEERRGYAAGDQVLRYAEVVVVRNRNKTSNHALSIAEGVKTSNVNEM
jgi:molecular chaperone GrpE (heat shock protein)